MPEDATKIGEGAIPQTDAELLALITEEFPPTNLELPDSKAERLVAKFGAHPNIDRIALNLTDAIVRAEDPAAGTNGAVTETSISTGEDDPGEEADETKPRPLVASRTPAQLRTATITGRPLYIESFPLTLDVDIKNVAFEWLTDTEGGLWAKDGEQKLNGFVATAEVEGDIDQARDTIWEIAQMAAEESGAHLRHLEFDIDVARPMLGEQLLTLAGTASGRYKIFGTKVRFSVEAMLENATGVLTLRDIQLRSGNPMVALALLVFRKQVRQLVGQSTSLIEGLPEHYRIDNLELRLRGRRLSATLRIV